MNTLRLILGYVCLAIFLFYLAVGLFIALGTMVDAAVKAVRRFTCRFRPPEPEPEEHPTVRLTKNLMGLALRNAGDDVAWHYLLWATSMDRRKYLPNIAMFTTDEYAAFVSRFGLSKEQAEAELERLGPWVEELMPLPQFPGQRLWHIPRIALEIIDEELNFSPDD